MSNGKATINMSLCPIEAIHRTLVFAVKDWSIDKNDAWIYGIVVGWDDNSIAELKAKFLWSDEVVERLKTLHNTCSKLRQASPKENL